MNDHESKKTSALSFMNNNLDINNILFWKDSILNISNENDIKNNTLMNLEFFKKIIIYKHFYQNYNYEWYCFQI